MKVILNSIVTRGRDLPSRPSCPRYRLNESHFRGRGSCADRVLSGAVRPQPTHSRSDPQRTYVTPQCPLVRLFRPPWRTFLNSVSVSRGGRFTGSSPSCTQISPGDMSPPYPGVWRKSSRDRPSWSGRKPLVWVHPLSKQTPKLFSPENCSLSVRRTDV